VRKGRGAVLCSPKLANHLAERIRSVAPDRDVIALGEGERLADEDLERVEIACFSGDLYPDGVRSFFGAAVRARNLRWLHSSSAGVDDPVFPRLLAAGVRLTNSSGAAAPAIARTVAMYLLALSRQLPALMRAQSTRTWSPRRYVDLEGGRLGVVGLGPIGREVVGLAPLIGMTPIGMRRRVSGDEACETWSLDRLTELAGVADALVVALPLNDETRGLVSRELIDQMRPGALFVNVGRGEIHDEEALIAALERGRLGGAALDVFAVEPLPPDSPLWALPNVILTPHMSGATESTWRRSAELFLSNLGAFLVGRPLTNEIVVAP
jgi:D-2-hydroxyacid dehydrogenase (NADP+)